MKKTSLGEKAEISSLWSTEQQKNITLAFDMFEKQEWTLQEIIEYILKKHKIETTDSRIKAIDSRKFSIGSLQFHFNLIEDWEAPDDTTYYSLELTLSLLDINDKTIKATKIKNIQTKETFDPFWGMESDDKLSFTEKMEEYTAKILKNIDQSKTKNLYDYIYNYYSNFIDKINNKEISL